MRSFKLSESIITQFFIITFVLICSAFGQTPTPTPATTATPTPAILATPSPTPAPIPVQVQMPRGVFPPPQYIPEHDYDQRNIRLDLRFDWEREQAIGTATITLAPTVKDLQQVEFDAAYLTISGVTLASGTSLKFQHDGVKERLSVFLDRPYQP